MAGSDKCWVLAKGHKVLLKDIRKLILVTIIRRAYYLVWIPTMVA